MKLTHTLNRTVLVSIPAFFGDEDARTCSLVDVEPAGLWLACDELKERLGPDFETAAARTAPVSAFFPFAQILYVVDPSQFSVLARGGPRPGPSKPAQASPPRRVTRADEQRDERRKQKDGKPRR